MTYQTEFPFGDRVRIVMTFTDPDTGAAVDPDTVRFHFKDPSGALTVWTFGTDPEVIKDAAGTFRVMLDGDTAGLWKWAWRSSGNWRKALKGFFYVEPDELAA